MYCDFRIDTLRPAKAYVLQGARSSHVRHQAIIWDHAALSLIGSSRTKSLIRFKLNTIFFVSRKCIKYVVCDAAAIKFRSQCVEHVLNRKTGCFALTGGSNANVKLIAVNAINVCELRAWRPVRHSAHQISMGNELLWRPVDFSFVSILDCVHSPLPSFTFLISILFGTDFYTFTPWIRHQPWVRHISTLSSTHFDPGSNTF